MARIPLAEIPNAEYHGGGVGMIGVPDFRVNMGPAAGMLRQGGVEGRPFVEAAGAGAMMGQAVRQASGLFAKLAEQMAESKNQADLSRAEEIMAKAQAAHAQEMARTPEGEWGALWENKYLPQANKEMSALKMSAWTMDRVGPRFDKFAADTRRAVGYDAFKAQVGRDKQAILNGITRETEAGNYEGALSGISRLVAGHHVTPEQGEKMSDEIEVRARESHAIQWMNDDPNGFMEALEAEEIPMPPPEKLRMRQQAGTLSRQRRSEAVQALDDDILKGTVKTEEQVRQRAAVAGLSERDTQSFVEALMVAEANTPEGRTRYLKTYDDLFRRSVAYDPADDPDGVAGAEILRSVRTEILAGERQTLLENLRGAMREGRTESRRRATRFEDGIDRLASRGMLVAMPANFSNRAVQVEYEANVIRKTAELKKAAREWLKENPKSDPVKEQRWFMENVGPDVRRGNLRTLANE